MHCGMHHRGAYSDSAISCVCLACCSCHATTTRRRAAQNNREGVSLELTSFQIVFAEREKERRGDVCLRTHETLIGSGMQAGKERDRRSDTVVSPTISNQDLKALLTKRFMAGLPKQILNRV